MKLTRRRVLLTATLFAVVAALSLAFLLGFGGDRITQANVNRIRIGMTLEQVVKILGPPTVEPDSKFREEGVIGTIWEGKDCCAVVTFQDGRATGKRFIADQYSWWSRVMRMFGL